MRPIIFDVDGVLADFIQGFTTLASMKFETPITITRDQPKWDGFPGLTDKQIDETWREVRRSDSYWLDLPSLVGPEVFRRISNLRDFAPVYFVTSRPGRSPETQTRLWLEEHGVHSPSVIVSERKGEIACAIQAAYSIEDKAGNAIAIAWLSPRTQSFILDHPYNLFDNSVVGSRVQRVSSVMDYIDRTEGSRAVYKPPVRDYYDDAPTDPEAAE